MTTPDQPFKFDPSLFKLKAGFSGTDFHFPEGLRVPSRLLSLGNFVDFGHEVTTQKLFVDVRSDSRFNTMHRFHQCGALTAETVLNLSASFGYLDLAKAKRMIDFGAGAGGPTLALAQLAGLNGGTVEAVESNLKFVEDMIAMGIVDAEHAHQGNGITLLGNETSRATYDLVTAFMLGPDSDGGLTRDLLKASQNALTAGGHLVITSDMGTMSVARRVCDQQGTKYEYVTGVPTETGPMPDILIASFPEK